MYTIDADDRVLPLRDVPQSDVGAPMPIVFADDYTLILAYILRNSVSPHNDDNAFVKFVRPRKHMFGSPNDEAFHGHPLWSRGLRPYSAYLVENSSWIRQLERMNSVHPYHKAEQFLQLRHYIFAFHDSTFECVAQSYTVEVVRGPLQSMMAELHRLWTQ